MQYQAAAGRISIATVHSGPCTGLKEESLQFTGFECEFKI